jgi:hypothetical protein
VLINQGNQIIRQTKQARPAVVVRCRAVRGVRAWLWSGARGRRWLRGCASRPERNSSRAVRACCSLCVVASSAAAQSSGNTSAVTGWFAPQGGHVWYLHGEGVRGRQEDWPVGKKSDVRLCCCAKPTAHKGGNTVTLKF